MLKGHSFTPKSCHSMNKTSPSRLKREHCAGKLHQERATAPELQPAAGLRCFCVPQTLKDPSEPGEGMCG